MSLAAFRRSRRSPASVQATGLDRWRAPPVRGWNRRDDEAALKPTDATLLDNWWPEEGKVTLRRGSALQVEGLGGSVESLFGLDQPAGAKALAAANGTLWDVSALGAPNSLAGGFGSDVWDSDPYEKKRPLVNGVDDPQVWDGATVAPLTISGAGPPALDPKNLVGVTFHRNRGYWWEAGQLRFWYGGSGAIGGPLSGPFDLSLIGGGLEGELLAVGSATVKGKAGGWGGKEGESDDLAIFVISSGHIVAYAGNNPADANEWGLVGVYPVARPIGRRCILKLGDDLVIVTEGGYLPLRAIFARGTLASVESPVSDRIRDAVKLAARSYKTLTGWQPLLHPNGEMLLVNVPVSASDSVQHVLNTATRAWARFTKWPARCFAGVGAGIWFGTADGRVIRADEGSTDLGADIVGEVRQAWDPFGSPAQHKRSLLVRPHLRAAGPVKLSAGVETDFDSRALGQDQQTLGAVVEAVNHITLPVNQIATPVNAPPGFRNLQVWLDRPSFHGHYLAWHMIVAASAPCDWHGTEWTLKLGRGL